MQVTCIDGFLNHSVKMVSFIKYPIIFIPVINTDKSALIELLATRVKHILKI